MAGNPTEAKEIALYFLSIANQELTKPNISRSVIVAKNLLAKGYPKRDIMEVIDYVCEKKSPYSLSYVATAYPDVIKAVEEKRLHVKAKAELELLEQYAKEKQGEVREDDGTTERNRNKSSKFGVQSRVGTKYHFDLFEGNGQDNGSGK